MQYDVKKYFKIINEDLQVKCVIFIQGQHKQRSQYIMVFVNTTQGRLVKAIMLQDLWSSIL